MPGFLRIIELLAIIWIVIMSTYFIVVWGNSVESMWVKETLQKVLLVLGVLAIGGVAVSFLAGKKQ